MEPPILKNRKDIVAAQEELLEVDLRVVETLIKNAASYSKKVLPEELNDVIDTIAERCYQIRCHLQEPTVLVSPNVKNEMVSRVQSVEEALATLWPEQRGERRAA